MTSMAEATALYDAWQQAPSDPVVRQRLLEAWSEVGLEIVAAGACGVPPVQVTNPQVVGDLMVGLLHGLDHEELWTVELDTMNRVLSMTQLYVGGRNEIHVWVGEMFKAAVRQNAMSIIIVHNHPSGSTTPSPEDVRLTRDVVAAGKLLNITVLDHLIVGGTSHVSLRQMRLGFDS